MNLNYLRFALYGILFMLAMVLFNFWQKEHPQPVAVANPGQLMSPEEAPNVAAMAAVTAVESATPRAGNDLVRVKTDVLQATIDLNGGNLVNVTLPTYPESLKQPQTPYQLFNNNPDSLYIAQSGIRNVNPPYAPIAYRTSSLVHVLSAGQDAIKVSLEGENNQGIKFTKTYVFNRKSYLIPVEVTATNVSRQIWRGQGYEQLLRKKAEQSGGLGGVFHFNSFLGAAYSTQEQPYQKIAFRKMTSSNLAVSSQSGWVAMIEHYFLSAWVPHAGQDLHFYTQTEGQLYSIGVVSAAKDLVPGQSMTQQAKLYVGPLITHDLEGIAPHLDLTVDYGWLWIISEALFWLLNKIHSIVGNWGWAIVLVTVLVKSLFYKLSAASYRSMAAMRAMQPRIQALRERYGDDKQKLSQSMMEIYRKEKINPLGGCLPMLVQIPVFLALYWVLFSSVELRQAPFILWIKDLSMPDPYYVLPILMGLSMFIQQKLSPPPPDPTQAKIMMLMPLVLTLFFLNFPAGLVLYWVVNNSLSIMQQSYIMHRLAKHPLKRK